MATPTEPEKEVIFCYFCQGTGIEKTYVFENSKGEKTFGDSPTPWNKGYSLKDVKVEKCFQCENGYWDKDACPHPNSSSNGDGINQVWHCYHCGAKYGLGIDLLNTLRDLTVVLNSLKATT